jgi:hypothetical protein
MEQFVMGAIAMASAIAALYFLRFWRDTGDRLFAIFALAFLLLGITRLGLAVTQAKQVGQQAERAASIQVDPGAPAEQELSEGETSWYWVRLTAFLLILAAIIDKNRR